MHAHLSPTGVGSRAVVARGYGTAHVPDWPDMP
jgi:hypothetical protein